MSFKKPLLHETDHDVLLDTYKVIDVNINRCKEGLRVCEDIARFHLKNLATTKKIGALRHRLTSIIKTSHCDTRLFYRSRDIAGDPGKACACGPKRSSFRDIFMANSQRIKEALRVLEEFLKIMDIKTSGRIQKLRFDFYALEKKTVEKFPGLLSPR